MVTHSLQATAWVQPKRLVLSDHLQVIARLRRPEGSCKGNRQGFILTELEATHYRRSCLALLAQEQELRHIETDFFSRLYTGVVEMATQGQNTTSSLRHWTAKQRVPEEKHAWLRSRGHNEREWIQGRHKLEHTTCTANGWRKPGGAEQIKRFLQRQNERTRGQANEGE